MSYTEADERADTAFLVGVHYGRESERALMLSEGYVIPETTKFVMAPRQWIGALADAWWLGHRDVCTDCNCRDDSNPYHVKGKS